VAQPASASAALIIASFTPALAPQRGPTSEQKLERKLELKRRGAGMWLLLLEALAAGLILVFIVWWTMFSGRKGGELNKDAPDETAKDKPRQDPPA
jgi:hypothetical protein